jgi:uncharacterized protein (TIGR02421 family)
MTRSPAERIEHVSNLLFEASQSIRILSHVSWDASVREKFFAGNAKELPEVSYPKFDPSPVIEIIAAARLHIENSFIDEWLTRLADGLEDSARMMACAGTSEFFSYSRKLFGVPNDPLPDKVTTSLSLARRFDELLTSVMTIDLGEPPQACFTAQAVASAMTTAVNNMFGHDAPEVLVVDELSANALAGPRRIRIRHGACFSDKDINQLIEHEAYIHVATSLNGLAQTHLKILGASHPRITRTQEGLAVFAEFITGSIDLGRMRRLADRVIAIQMAIDGADFLDVYHYFLARIENEGQSFENARRVFRGGTVSGGSPFTKDMVYLDGLLSVHNFLRCIVSSGRSDCLRLLFSGKLDIEDIPVIHELTEMGLCQPAKYLPPWASDLRYLLCYLAYSSFLNGVDLTRVRAHYETLLERIPKSGT